MLENPLINGNVYLIKCQIDGIDYAIAKKANKKIVLERYNPDSEDQIWFWANCSMFIAFYQFDIAIHHIIKKDCIVLVPGTPKPSVSSQFLIKKDRILTQRSKNGISYNFKTKELIIDPSNPGIQFEFVNVSDDYIDTPPLYFSILNPKTNMILSIPENNDDQVYFYEINNKSFQTRFYYDPYFTGSICNIDNPYICLTDHLDGRKGSKVTFSNCLSSGQYWIFRNNRIISAATMLPLAFNGESLVTQESQQDESVELVVLPITNLVIRSPDYGTPFCLIKKFYGCDYALTRLPDNSVDLELFIPGRIEQIFCSSDIEAELEGLYLIPFRMDAPRLADLCVLAERRRIGYVRVSMTPGIQRIFYTVDATENESGHFRYIPLPYIREIHTKLLGKDIQLLYETPYAEIENK